MVEKKPDQLSMTTVAIVGFCLAVALSIFFFLQNESRLVLRDKDTNQEYSVFEVYEGLTFSISFNHSVNQSIVREIYQIHNHKIYLESCEYSTFGAGVATEIQAGQQLSYTESGNMVISNIHEEMPNLSYVVSTLSDQILTIEETTINLIELCGKNSIVAFQIER